MIDWTKLITDVTNQLGESAGQTLEKHKDFLEKSTKEAIVEFFTSLANDEKEKLDGAVQLTLLQSLSDDEFLALRKKTADMAKNWEDLSAKKREVIHDFTSNFGKVAAQVVVRYLLLNSL